MRPCITHSTQQTENALKELRNLAWGKRRCESIARNPKRVVNKIYARRQVCGIIVNRLFPAALRGAIIILIPTCGYAQCCCICAYHRLPSFALYGRISSRSVGGPAHYPPPSINYPMTITLITFNFITFNLQPYNHITFDHRIWYYVASNDHIARAGTLWRINDRSSLFFRISEPKTTSSPL